MGGCEQVPSLFGWIILHWTDFFSMVTDPFLANIGRFSKNWIAMVQPFPSYFWMIQTNWINWPPILECCSRRSGWNFSIFTSENWINCKSNISRIESYRQIQPFLTILNPIFLLLFLGAVLWNELWLKQRFNDNAKVTNTATTPTTPLLFLFYYSIESNFNFSIRFRFISLSLSVPIFGPDQFSTNLMRPISRGGSK